MSPPAALEGDHASFDKANRLGVLSMIGAMARFIVNDGLVKYVSQTLPVLPENPSRTPDRTAASSRITLPIVRSDYVS